MHESGNRRVTFMPYLVYSTTEPHHLCEQYALNQFFYLIWDFDISLYYQLILLIGIEHNDIIMFLAPPGQKLDEPLSSDEGKSKQL